MVFLYVGCTSIELKDEESPDPVPSPIEAPQETSPAPDAKEEEAVQQAPDEGETNINEEEVTPEGNDSYEMGEEEYQATKKDLSELVQRLNDIISKNNYEEWLDYLTSDYIDYYNDPEVLKKYSESPTMKKYNIKLRTLKDYFNYVVVASRRDVRIDDIKAISENEVKAYMIINDEPIVVYTLKKVDGRWNITR